MTRRPMLRAGLAVLLLVCGLAAPGPADAQAKPEISDAALSAKVKSAINADAALRKMDISIEVLDKVVHLSGFVSSMDAMHKAEALTRAVEGVADVVNRLRVQNRPSRA
jgi:hyperosmotically inducible protein